MGGPGGFLFEPREDPRSVAAGPTPSPSPPSASFDDLRMELIYAAHTLASEAARPVRPEGLLMWRSVLLVRAERLLARARILCGEG